jgi:hypothetical protein
MHFDYRGFEIECVTTGVGAGFIGTVTIWQVHPADEDRKVFTSNSPGWFPTQLQAIDHARVWSEMWCDAQLTSEWAPRYQMAQRRPIKKPKTTSRKPLEC